MKRKKTGGREAGTPNKTTAQMRSIMADFVRNKFEDFESAFDEIEEPKDRADIYIKACKFVIPALQSVSLSTEDGQDKSIEQTLGEMAQKLIEIK